jgi:hypothetical protein
VVLPDVLVGRRANGDLLALRSHASPLYRNER